MIKKIISYIISLIIAVVIVFLVVLATSCESMEKYNDWRPNSDHWLEDSTD